MYPATYIGSESSVVGLVDMCSSLQPVRSITSAYNPHAIQFGARGPNERADAVCSLVADLPVRKAHTSCAVNPSMGRNLKEHEEASSVPDRAVEDVIFDLAVDSVACFERSRPDPCLWRSAFALQIAAKTVSHTNNASVVCHIPAIAFSCPSQCVGALWDRLAAETRSTRSGARG